MKRILLLLVLLPLLPGCAHNTKCLGTIGETRFYRVGSGRFVGPNFSAFVTENLETHEVTIHETFGGPGIGAAVISSVGHVGAAAVLGTSFPKNVGDQETTTVTGGNSGAASNSAAGSASQSNSASSSSGTATGGGTWTPPGLINNPGHSKP